MPSLATTPAQRALTSLVGLAIGDGFGAQFAVPSNRAALAERRLPPGPWEWTDDTEMACSIHAELGRRGGIDADALAGSFAAHHDVDRGYGPGTDRMLRLIRQGGDWRELAARQFDGAGSWGNGAAMRVAPLGAWFAHDPAEAARQAAVSARVTHTHPEAVAGAIAVAVAGAVAARREPVGPAAFLDEVGTHVPAGLVRDGVNDARGLLVTSDTQSVARELGCGQRISAMDTVPFTLWSAAKHLDDYAAALWATATPGGDVDTTCAIVGGIVASRAPGGHLPPEWRRRMEPLPPWAGAPGTV